MQKKANKLFIKQIMKKRIYSLSFVFLLLLSFLFFIPVDNVKGIHAGYVYTEDFSDHANNEQAYEGWFYSEEHTSKFACDGSGNFDIYRAWDGAPQGTDDPSGTFNYYYEYDVNIKNLSFNIHRKAHTTKQIIFILMIHLDNLFLNLLLMKQHIYC